MQGLDLIPWRTVGFTALWILGLAVILTLLGFADYHAGVEGTRARQILHRPVYRAGINGGLTLFCLGLLGSSGAWWETILWGLLTLGFAYTAWRALKERGTAPEEMPLENEHDPSGRG